jgi:CHASE1-domain containing sensor protein/PAS domain-containing protein
VRNVSPSAEASFVAQSRADGRPDFAIRTLTAHQQNRFIIQYIYPEVSNQGATGLDIGSEVNRRNAALVASRDGLPTLTAPITLVQAAGKKRSGFLTLLPIYDPALPLSSPEAREKATLGWIYAPLVVDEVLANLDPVLREVSLVLSDQAESKPFFATHSLDVLSGQRISSVKRNMQLMGRKWLLESHSLAEMSAALGLWSPIWVATLGLLGTSIVALLLSIVLIKQESEKTVVNPAQVIGMIYFFSSVFFKRIIIAYVVLMLLLIGATSLSYLQQLKSASTQLTTNLHQSLKLLQQQQKLYDQDLTFLQSTPAVKGIVETSRKGIDPNNSNSIREWTGQLAEIFKAYMVSSPDVYQVRLIRANPSGRELIRIGRTENGIFVVPSDQLRYKGDRPYMQEILTLDQGDIWVSDLGLNVENEVIETPFRPTLRYATPIFNQDKSPFGIIIINIEAKPIFNELKALAQPDQVIYAINQQGDDVFHPDMTKIFRSDFGDTFQWDNEFTFVSSPFGLQNSEIKAWEGPSSSILSAEGKSEVNSGQLIFKVTLLTSIVYQKTISALLNLFLPLIGLVVFSIFVIYLFWVINQRKVVDTETQLQQDIQHRKDDIFKSLTELSPEAIIFTDVTGMIVLVNSQAEKLFGYDRIDMLGQDISMLVPQSIAANHHTHVKNFVVNQKLDQWEKVGNCLVGIRMVQNFQLRSV